LEKLNFLSFDESYQGVTLSHNACFEIQTIFLREERSRFLWNVVWLVNVSFLKYAVV
jgi:hypothetical protein